MEKLKLTEIAKIFNQEVTTELVIESISTDSRQNSPNSLFIALTGENFDGHNYIHKAYQNGAVACISQKPIKDLPNVIVVENTREAMLKIAKYYKSLFNTFTVGVTGSVGKTSTKEMIYTILQGSGKTLKTFGNLNNEIGLPKMVFMLDRTYKNAVFEMGMSDLNQIAPLSKTVSPNVGVITNIGICHIETLKTQENILKAKLEITQGMVADAPLVLNGDDALLRSLELDR
ncbi:MAG: UDP-N-acetylmuramoyl-tripeptide--D-alanyl-D-alanine ligase, partial [Oscillospiraceae bacterium]